MDEDLEDYLTEEDPRWNDWITVQSVQFVGERVPRPRRVRLCCACCRVGDPVQISEGGNEVIEGRIEAVASGRWRCTFCRTGALSVASRHADVDHLFAVVDDVNAWGSRDLAPVHFSEGDSVGQFGHQQTDFRSP